MILTWLSISSGHVMKKLKNLHVIKHYCTFFSLRNSWVCRRVRTWWERSGYRTKQIAHMPFWLAHFDVWRRSHVYLLYSRFSLFATLLSPSTRFFSGKFTKLEISKKWSLIELTKKLIESKKEGKKHIRSWIARFKGKKCEEKIKERFKRQHILHDKHG